MIELGIEHSQVPSVRPRHEAPSRLRPPQRSRVAGVKKQKYNTKYNTNTYDIKYTPPSGVLSFPGLYALGGPGGSPCAPLPRVLAVHLALGYAQCLTLSSIM
jgi:hypothetical protein